MELELAGTVALVAGSTRGIGLAVARAFHAEGAHVVVTGRDESALASAAGSLGDERVTAERADMSDPEEARRVVEAALAEHGRLDSAVANVGSGSGPAGWRLSTGDWEAALTANLRPAHVLAEAVLPAMTQAGRGALVFVSSITGVETTGAPLPYGAAKAAVLSYSAGLARQVGADGVRVNCVAPGNVLFPGGSWARKLEEDGERHRETVEREVALRRFGTPEEIADVVVFLCSARASFVTGTCVVADGGQTRSYLA